VTAEETVQAATTGLGVVDYARLAGLLTERQAPLELWGAVADLLAARGEAEAWERYLGITYPAESPTVLED
jgi:hypothetical protein